jgi:hypothetical protein
VRRHVVSRDEFDSPLHIYHSTKDSNGDRSFYKLALPTELLNNLQRFMRENSTFLTTHQILLNAVHYGLDAMKEHGLAPESKAFQHLLETEDVAAHLQATAKLIETSQHNWHAAKTPDQRATVSAKIREIASQTTDPQIAHELRQILS